MGEGMYVSVTDAARVSGRRVTSVALVEVALAVARSLDHRLGVYVTRFDAGARVAAERADGEPRGPLHGIPVGVKDAMAAAHGPITSQSLREPGPESGRPDGQTGRQAHTAVWRSES